MAYVRRAVERIIESDPTIKTGLQRGIINSRALSRYILENCSVDSTPDAVVGILRRYPLDTARNERQRSTLRDCSILIRSGMAYLTVENSQDAMKRVAEFAGTIRSTRGENFRVVVGSNSARIIASQETLNTFKQTFASKDIIAYKTALAEICLLLTLGTDRLGEIAASIIAQLTLNRVNIAGMLVCPPEDIVLVSENDAPRTLEALQQLLQDEAQGRNAKIPRLKNGFARSDKFLTVFRFDQLRRIPFFGL